MDRGAWRATVHGAAKSWTQLSDYQKVLMVSNYCSSLGPLSSLEPLSLPHSGSYPFIKVISVKLFWVHHLSRILNISELGSSKHWDSCV